MSLHQALLMILAGTIGTCGFALLFRMRKKLIVWAVLGGALTVAVYALCVHWFSHAFFQNLLPALFGAVYAECLARLTRSPATQYLACAIIPLVPGSGLYHTMYAFITSDMPTFHTELTQTARVAAGLAVGIICVSVLMHQLRRRRNKELFELED